MGFSRPSVTLEERKMTWSLMSRGTYLADERNEPNVAMHLDFGRFWKLATDLQDVYHSYSKLTDWNIK
jgi:hypothetical protein